MLAVAPEVVELLEVLLGMVEDLVETSARTGMAALGAGSGMETYESTKMSS